MSNCIMELCTICKNSLQDGQATVVLREKGSNSINNASTVRSDAIHTVPGQSVHQVCRRSYCNKNVILRELKSQQAPSTPKISLRSKRSAFHFSEHCLFCGLKAKVSGRKRGYDVFPVRTSDFQTNIENVCLERNDDWAYEVQSRLNFAQDLHAVDAVYHQVCNVNFRTHKNIPAPFQTDNEAKSVKQLGRPTNFQREIAFQSVLDYLNESDACEEQVTICDLVDKMKCNGSGEAYSCKYMKTKLKEHFGDDIIIASSNGKSDVVTPRRAISSVLHDFYNNPRLNSSRSEELRVIETAAELMKADIKSFTANKAEYPTPDDLASLDKNKSFVPESLRVLLRCLFSEKNADVKIASIGQAIVQATRPRSIIAPLQMGLAVQMHHHFGSKFLIDSLNSHGFCSSYSEVKKFEASAAAFHSTDIPGITSEHLIQYVADNADHNSDTLDGYNTFHGMGIIATVTPGTKHKRPIPRITSKPTDVSLKKIDVHFFQVPQNKIANMVYDAVTIQTAVDPSAHLDLLWKVSWPLRSPRIGWSGLMQSACQGSYPGVSSVTFLPLIDMNASDISCVYSTLIYVCSEAKRHGVKPVLTFDQPLWWKAQMIIANEPANSDLQNVVLRLGGFHIQMSFLGCVGHIMSGSGLQEILQTVYASNSVSHMLSGKAVARAVRGHLLVSTALYALLVSNAFGCSVTERVGIMDDTVNNSGNDTIHAHHDLEPFEEHKNLDGNLLSALNLYDRIWSDEDEVSGVVLSTEELKCIESVQRKLDMSKDILSQSRTASLWIQYLTMIDLLLQFIKSERTGHWQLHLSTLSRMLPYFAASGHNMYTKSVSIYLQQMTQLETTHPDIFHFFTNGFHVVRRSDRFWGGLSTDLVIEQVLMKCMKSTGGLTHGRGLTESQRTVWLLSLPACAQINQSMQTITDTDFVTSDQHKDMTRARKIKDTKDATILLKFLYERNPFTTDESLYNVVTGVTADTNVNSDQAKDVGERILQSMVGANATEYTFKKKHQVITFNEKSLPKVDGEPIHVDPQLLFQRLVTAARNTSEHIADVFKYDLCGYPPSLFEASGLLRQANKPQLANAIGNLVKDQDIPLPFEENMQYVLDGGSLLQRLPWPRGSTFDSLCSMYTDYVKRKYISPIIVFDGYLSSSCTKDATHQRRYGPCVGPEVNFVDNTPVVSKKEQFLSNKKNKQKFINMVSNKLEKADCRVRHAEDDADLLISLTAVESSLTTPTTVIGEDTDLLVLLCFHANPASNALYMRSEGKQSMKNARTWNILHIKNTLGLEICSCLPFVHAVAGCDTTSRLFGIGKGLPLKKLMSEPFFRKQAQVFSRRSQKEDIILAGEKSLVCLYGGSIGEGLDILRYKKFSEKVMTSTSFVQIQTLPPTSSAAKYHSLRVYLQTQQWMANQDLIPEEWGWTEVNQRLHPCMSDLSPAPENLLRVIRCKCKTDCDTKRCTCRKLGLDCSAACGECKGVVCSNVSSSCVTSDDNDAEELAEVVA